ncbi:TRAP transporter substrate-binding protein [Acidovorax soli]|uniref:TRAP transporter substrate-binding protein n=1 Tax=Acidovorax TaxID=12916 RepID=UPI0026EB4769|nr:TRAP transporter substrate-binding protein [Acidovorax soli]MCM2347192.1 TRAP transporter substrate-binding protein [Acidovorax soli]
MIFKAPQLLSRRVAMMLGLCAFSFGISSPVVAAENIVLKVGHAATASNTGHLALEFLGKELKEKTKGRVSMEIFPNAQLGSERELVESIQLGNVDMAFVSSALLGNFNKQFFALDIPFMFKDRPGVYRVLDGAIGQGLLDSLNKVGIQGVGYWENGFRQLTNSKKLIKSPDDLKGMKMRTMENEVHIAAWKAIGSNPAPLAFGELFTALQQGTFDAQEGPINLFYDMKFQEVQKFITKTNHVYSPFVVLMNPNVYKRFSEEDKKIFATAFSNAKVYQRDLAQKADAKAEAAMPKVTFTTLTPQEFAKFADKMGPIYDQVKKKVGPEIVDKILAEVNKK